MGLDEFSWSDEVSDPRPLRILALVSGVVLLASIGVILLAGGNLGAWIAAVWLLAFVAALLVVRAVSGLYRRRVRPGWARVDTDELRLQAEVLRSLRRGQLAPDVPPEYVQYVVDDRAWTIGLAWGFGGAGFCWLLLAVLDPGHGFWPHLALGSSYAVGFAWCAINRHRVLRGAARLGITRRSRRERRLSRG